MSPLEQFSPETNFWEVNQQFKVANPFKKLYEKDKSKNKKTTSMMMWFVALCHDMESRFYNTPIDEKYPLIGEDYVGDINFYEENKDDLDILIQAYCNLQDTPAQRALRDWDEAILKRAKFLKEAEYSFDEFVEDERGKWIQKKGTATQLDTMHKNTKSIYADLERIMEDLVKEKEAGSITGGAKESLND